MLWMWWRLSGGGAPQYVVNSAGYVKCRCMACEAGGGGVAAVVRLREQRAANCCMAGVVPPLRGSRMAVPGDRMQLSHGGGAVWVGPLLTPKHLYSSSS